MRGSDRADLARFAFTAPLYPTALPHRSIRSLSMVTSAAQARPLTVSQPMTGRLEFNEPKARLSVTLGSPPETRATDLLGQAGQRERVSLSSANPGDPPAPRTAEATIRDLRAEADSLRLASGHARSQLQASSGAAKAPQKDGAGARGGVRLATAQQYAELLALRKQSKVKPLPPVPNPQVPNPQATAPHDLTEDHTEEKLLTWETIASGAELVASVAAMIQGNPESTFSLGSEFVGSLFGILPSLVTLVSRVKEGKDAAAVRQGATELLDQIKSIREKLDGLEVAEGDPLNDQIKELQQSLDKMSAGLKLAQTYGDRVVSASRAEARQAAIAVGGEVAGLIGGGATFASELGVASHAVGAVGGGVSGIAGIVALPFQVRMMNAARRQARTDETNLRSANAILESGSTPKRIDREKSDDTSGVRRGLAKFMARSSAPRENRFKAFLFGWGIASSATGIAFSGLMAAKLAGAAVGIVGTVGTLGLGLGIAGTLLLAGYFIGKYVTREKPQYSTADLKSVVAGDTNSDLMQTLSSRQQTKVANQLTAEMVRTKLSNDPTLRGILLDGVRAVKKSDVDSLNTQTNRLKAHVRSELERLNLSDPDPGRFTNELCSNLLVTLDAGLSISDGVSQLDFDDLPEADRREKEKLRDESISTRFSSALNQALLQHLASTEKTHTPMQTRDEWKNAMSSLIREGGQTKADLVARLKSELPLSDELIDGVIRGLEGADAEGTSGALQSLLDDSGAELARMSAMRKLIRRDPESLLFTCVDTLINTDPSSPEHQRLRDDLIRFGVKDKTLVMALGADTLENMAQAAGLLAREIQGRR